jgi:RNA polymerase sigma factor (TIGR02999 family)
MSESEEVTTLLVEWRHGNRLARDQLMALVYNELRRLAAHYLQQERPDHTLQPTALVHELYLRVVSTHKLVDWKDRAHFFALAATTLRHILVDHARARRAEKRGGNYLRVSLADANGWAKSTDEDVLAVEEALQQLNVLDARAAQVVELRFFSGLHEDEVAEVLGVTPRTVQRDWKFARAWLTMRLSCDAPQDT